MTKQTDYGFVLLSRMAADPGRVANAPDLAEECRLPLPMVSKILKMLARAGIVRSLRGVKGGYSLALAPERIFADQIVKALEGPVALTVCVDGSPGECDLEPYCSVRGHWQRINVAVESALARISLAELTAPTAASAAPLVQLGHGAAAGGGAARA